MGKVPSILILLWSTKQQEQLLLANCQVKTKPGQQNMLQNIKFRQHNREKLRHSLAEVHRFKNTWEHKTQNPNEGGLSIPACSLCKKVGGVYAFHFTALFSLTFIFPGMIDRLWAVSQLKWEEPSV